eukprot:1027982-Prymnesium_polylepis.1
MSTPPTPPSPRSPSRRAVTTRMCPRTCRRLRGFEGALQGPGHGVQKTRGGSLQITSLSTQATQIGFRASADETSGQSAATLFGEQTGRRSRTRDQLGSAGLLHAPPHAAATSHERELDLNGCGWI